MEVTNTDNQEVRVKNKIEDFFKKNIMRRKSTGICAAKDLMAVVTDKWSLFVIYNLGYYKTLRFNELRNNIRNISARMLSVTLKKLEERDLICRKAYAEVPPRVEYDLTPLGLELAEKMVDLNGWFMDEFVGEKLGS